MNKEDYEKILNKAISIHERFVRKHGLLRCNCFKDEFGAWLKEYFMDARVIKRDVASRVKDKKIEKRK